MLTSETEPIKWNLGANYQLLHCKINLIAENDAQTALYNAAPYQGMLYDVLENLDPKLSFQYHKSGNTKPWSYSLLKINKYEKTNRNGIYSINKGTKGYWILNALDQRVVEAFLKANKSESLLHFNDLELRIASIEYENQTYQTFPENNVKTITIQLHTPAYFYKAKNKELVPLSEESFLDFQLRKLHALNIIEDFDAKELRPFIRILRNDTRKKYLSMTLGGKTVRAYGNIGFITFKLNGDFQTKQAIWELIHTSQFTGIGTRTSMGFGHNSITSIK